MRNDWFVTVTGRRVFVLEPDPEQIAIDDIAHALAHVCRFGGHCRRFYSVAQHSVLVSRLVPDEDRLAGLLHDATEAYLGDVIRPLKRELRPAYHDIEQRWHEAISRRFGLAVTLPASVKRADMIALATERRDLINPTVHENYGGEWIEDELGVEPAPDRITPQSSSQARTFFLDRFRQLTAGWA